MSKRFLVATGAGEGADLIVLVQRMAGRPGGWGEVLMGMLGGGGMLTKHPSVSPSP